MEKTQRTDSDEEMDFVAFGQTGRHICGQIDGRMDRQAVH